jgi:hypothetical protein
MLKLLDELLLELGTEELELGGTDELELESGGSSASDELEELLLGTEELELGGTDELELGTKELELGTDELELELELGSGGSTSDKLEELLLGATTQLLLGEPLIISTHSLKV